MKNLLLMLLASLQISAYAADKTQMPSDEDVANARNKAQAQSVFDQAEKSAQNPIVLPNVPMNAGQQGIDINQIANQKRQLLGLGESDDLYIFVSFSMPVETLKVIAKQAKQTNAVMILRGIPGGLTGKKNWQAAMNQLQPLVALGANVQIDPEQFKRYNILTVPSYVLALNNQNQKQGTCSPEGCMAKSLKTTGDASIDYVLSQWTSDKNQLLAKAAQRRLKLLEGS
jgi:conjugal transfer pilus assembly protein TrbC